MLRYFVLLLLLAAPAWGDTIILNASSFWGQSTTDQTIFGPNGGLAYVGNGQFWIFGNTGSSISGAGTEADPFLYGATSWYLIQDSSHGTGISCQTPCSLWQTTSLFGYFPDADHFVLQGMFTATFDPIFYWELNYFTPTYFGPQYSDGVGSFSFHLTREAYNYWHVDSSASSVELHPVPEPATMLLIGSGLVGSYLRRRHA